MKLQFFEWIAVVEKVGIQMTRRALGRKRIGSGEQGLGQQLSAKNHRRLKRD